MDFVRFPHDLITKDVDKNPVLAPATKIQIRKKLMDDILTIQELRNNYIMFGLLVDPGLSEEALKSHFNKAILNYMKEITHSQIQFVSSVEVAGGVLAEKQKIGLSSIISYLEGAASQWEEESLTDSPGLIPEDF